MGKREQMGQFNNDLKLEEKFYNEIFKPWLNSRGNDSIFIRFNSNSIIYEDLQKKNDIDVILDNGKENVTLSLKTVRKVYSKIFFETVSNNNKKTPGWGIYSKANYIIYSMGNFQKGFICRSFRLADVPEPNNFPIGWGETRDKYGNLLYKTKGRLIPWSAFEHQTLFNSHKQGIK